MAITLDSLILPEDLIWQDEYYWTPVQQSVAYSLGGALIVQCAQKLAGRSITLAGSDNSGLAARSVIDDLMAKLTANAVMTLVLNDARNFQVRFRNNEQPIEAKPLIDYSTPDAADWYSLTLRLIQV